MIFLGLAALISEQETIHENVRREEVDIDRKR
jgi:hypothetical protein